MLKSSVVDQPDLGVEEPLELEADQDGGEHHRHHHDRAEGALAADHLGHELRDAEAQEEFDVHRQRHEENGAAERRPKQRIVRKQMDVVLEADQLVGLGRQAVVRQAQVERVDHRNPDHEKHDQDRRQEQGERQSFLAEIAGACCRRSGGSLGDGMTVVIGPTSRMGRPVRPLPSRCVCLDRGSRRTDTVVDARRTPASSQLAHTTVRLLL